MLQTMSSDIPIFAGDHIIWISGALVTGIAVFLIGKLTDKF
jgi:hypothetical protein